MQQKVVRFRDIFVEVHERIEIDWGIRDRSELSNRPNVTVFP